MSPSSWTYMAGIFHHMQKNVATWIQKQFKGQRTIRPILKDKRVHSVPSTHLLTKYPRDQCWPLPRVKGSTMQLIPWISCLQGTADRLTTVFVPKQDEASWAFDSRGNADTTTYGQAKPAHRTPEKVRPTFGLPFICQPAWSFSVFPVSAQCWGWLTKATITVEMRSWCLWLLYHHSQSWLNIKPV